MGIVALKPTRPRHPTVQAVRPDLPGERWPDSASHPLLVAKRTPR